MYYLVTTDDDNRCQSYTFGTKEALTDEVNLLSQRNEYVEIIEKRSVKIIDTPEKNVFCIVTSVLFFKCLATDLGNSTLIL